MLTTKSHFDVIDQDNHRPSSRSQSLPFIPQELAGNKPRGTNALRRTHPNVPSPFSEQPNDDNSEKRQDDVPPTGFNNNNTDEVSEELFYTGILSLCSLLKNCGQFEIVGTLYSADRSRMSLVELSVQVLNPN